MKRLLQSLLALVSLSTAIGAWAIEPAVSPAECARLYQVIHLPRPGTDLGDLSSFKRRYFEFHKVGAKDNRAFIKYASDHHEGLYLDLENAVLKQLNDTVLGDKDLVTALTNYHKELVLKKITGDPELEKHVLAKYSDFKSIRLLFDRDTPAIRLSLQKIYDSAAEQFAELVANSSIAQRISKARGLAGNPSAWFLAGFGRTADEAGMAARFARTFGAKSKIPVQDFSEAKGALDEKIYGAELLRKRLETKYSSIPGIFEPFGERPNIKYLPTRETIRLIRKVEPREATQEAYIEAVQENFKKMYGVDLPPADAIAFRDYIAAVDQFAPGISIERRVTIDMSKVTHGAIGADFTDQNGRNLKATMEALASSSSSEEAIFLARQNEKLATSDLDKRKKFFRDAMKKSIALDGKNVHFSGDDGVAFQDRSLTQQEKIAVVRSLSESPTPGDFRIVFLGEKADTGASSASASIKDCSACVIKAGSCAHCLVDGEDLEKKLRKALEGTVIPIHDSKHYLFAIDLERDDVLNIYIGGKSLPGLEEKVRETSEKLLKFKPQKIGNVIHVDDSGSASLATKAESIRHPRHSNILKVFDRRKHPTVRSWLATLQPDELTRYVPPESRVRVMHQSFSDQKFREVLELYARRMNIDHGALFAVNRTLQDLHEQLLRLQVKYANLPKQVQELFTGIQNGQLFITRENIKDPDTRLAYLLATEQAKIRELQLECLDAFRKIAGWHFTSEEVLLNGLKTHIDADAFESHMKAHDGVVELLKKMEESVKKSGRVSTEQQIKDSEAISHGFKQWLREHSAGEDVKDYGAALKSGDVEKKFHLNLSSSANENVLKRWRLDRFGYDPGDLSGYLHDTLYSPRVKYLEDKPPLIQQ